MKWCLSIRWGSISSEYSSVADDGTRHAAFPVGHVFCRAMSGVDRSVRVRALLDQAFPIVVLLLVVLAASGGWWAYQVHAAPDVEREEVTVSQWSTTTGYDHSAVIANDSLVFEEGERVRDRPVYYVNLVEELDVAYAFSHTAPSGGVDVRTDVRLEYRGTEGETVLWQYAEPLATADETNVTGGETHTVDATIDIESVFATIQRIQQELGSAGSIQIRVVSSSTVDGTLGGQPVNTTYESVMPITVTQQTLRVLELQTVEETTQRTDTVERTVEPGLAASIGSIAMVVLSVLGLLGLVVARRQGRIRLTPEERELLELHQQEQEFAEWITRGTFPSERDYEATILVDDLEGLVDVAIDSNRRVIQDEELGVSTVLDGEYIYVYVRPDSPAGDWLVNYADMTMDEFDRFEM